MNSELDKNRNRGPWCGVCETEKKSSNHWFKFVACDESFTVVELSNNDVVGVPVCGVGCATKRFSQWLGERIKAATQGPLPDATGTP